MKSTSRSHTMKMLEKKIYIAHRGLFDPSAGRPENSLPAFRYAAEKGYAIELDVQLTSDRKLVVFHDETLTRMCGLDKKVRECTYEEILSLRLGDSEEKVPLFSEVLKAIGGRVPVYVEIKSEGDWKATTEMTARTLDMYNGLFIIECFHPFVLLWLRLHRPQYIRGQLATDFAIEAPEKGKLMCFLMTHLAFNPLTRPDFVAYNYLYRDRFPIPSMKKKGSMKLVAWTIRSQEQLEESLDTFEAFIFDSFIPEA